MRPPAQGVERPHWRDVEDAIERVLDQQIAQGKNFVFTSNPVLASVESFTYAEFEYLSQAGYQIQQQKGGLFYAVKQ